MENPPLPIETPPPILPVPPSNLPHSKPWLTIISIGLAVIIIVTGGVLVLTKTSRPVAVPLPTPQITPTISLPSPTATPITSAPSISASPKKQPTTTPTSTPPSGVTFHLQTSTTSEPLTNFSIEVSKPDFSSVLKQTVSGNQYTVSPLAPGNYYVYTQVGDTSSASYCGSNNTGANLTERAFTVTSGNQKNIDVPIYPYPGFVYLKTPGGFPVTDATVAVTDASGNSVYYSTTSDQLGRAVVYTINPNPHWLKVTKNGQTYTQKITTSGCFWTEVVKPDFTFPLSQITVNINSSVDYLSLTPELVIPRSPDPHLKPNALTSTLNSDSVFTWSFDQTKCSGMPAAYHFGYQASLYPNSAQNSVTLPQVPPGRYTVCVYESGKPGVYWASSTADITVSDGQNQTVTITYPKPQ